MQSTLRWLNLLSVGSLMVSPVAAPAQQVVGQPAPPSLQSKIVGTWLHVSYHPESLKNRRGKRLIREELLTLRPDSSWTLQVKENGVPVPVDTAARVRNQLGNTVRWPVGADKGRWTLRGDRLWLRDLDQALKSAKNAEEKKWIEKRPDHMVELQDEQLVITDGYPMGGPENVNWILECNAAVFRRVDPSKPLPVATLPSLPPTTVKRENLVGTWVTRRLSGDMVDDTVALRADSTWTVVQMGKDSLGTLSPVRRDTGSWFILPGDLLWLEDPASDNGMSWALMATWQPPKITLQGQQFSLEKQDLAPGCNNLNKATRVLKRVMP